MNRRENLNLGEEINNIVQNALKNRNFSELNRDMGNAVKDALDEAKSSANWKSGKQYNWNNNRYEKKHAKNPMETHSRNLVNRNTKLSVKNSRYAVPVGRVTGTLFTVLGGIGTATFGIVLFMFTLLGFTVGSLFHTVSAFLLPLFLLSIFALVNGNRIRKRLQRFRKYLVCMKAQDYCKIDELAALTGFSHRFIEKDLQKMIKAGMFPQGHIDNKKTTFMLTNELYKQYLQVRYLEIKENIGNKSLKEGERQKFLKAAEEYEIEKEENKNISPEMRKSLDEGRKFILDIKNANVEIPGEEISNKLDRLEEVTEKIFDYVEIHPEKFAEIRKFTEYFLPTTLKLVEAYKKLDYQSVQGENISNAKKEIEDTMDTINLAFENLLDDLFQDMAMDISTDISVLETILAQEGLTENEIRVKNKNMEDKQ